MTMCLGPRVMHEVAAIDSARMTRNILIMDMNNVYTIRRNRSRADVALGGGVGADVLFITRPEPESNES